MSDWNQNLELAEGSLFCVNLKVDGSDIYDVVVFEERLTSLNIISDGDVRNRGDIRRFILRCLAIFFRYLAIVIYYFCVW